MMDATDNEDRTWTRKLPYLNAGSLGMRIVAKPPELGIILERQIVAPAFLPQETQRGRLERCGALADWERLLDAAEAMLTKLAAAKTKEDRDKAMEHLSSKVRVHEAIQSRVNALGQQ